MPQCYLLFILPVFFRLQVIWKNNILISHSQLWICCTIDSSSTPRKYLFALSQLLKDKFARRTSIKFVWFPPSTSRSVMSRLFQTKWSPLLMSPISVSISLYFLFPFCPWSAPCSSSILTGAFVIFTKPFNRRFWRLDTFQNMGASSLSRPTCFLPVFTCLFSSRLQRPLKFRR